ncbi:MAG: hypothetical protein JO076_01585 [Verrucomicrobia bacterium]|nr:hypothetical protein [Verrucomicrobiota bacterium]
MDTLSFASFAFETYNALRECAAQVKPCTLPPEVELTPLNLAHIAVQAAPLHLAAHLSIGDRSVDWVPKKANVYN